jgi:hypothetical protein
MARPQYPNGVNGLSTDLSRQDIAEPGSDISLRICFTPAVCRSSRELRHTDIQGERAAQAFAILAIASLSSASDVA